MWKRSNLLIAKARLYLTQNEKENYLSYFTFMQYIIFVKVSIDVSLYGTAREKENFNSLVHTHRDLNYRRAEERGLIQSFPIPTRRLWV